MQLLVQNVLKNPYIWGMALTYFFIYVVRQGVTSWFVFYLMQVRANFLCWCMICRLQANFSWAKLCSLMHTFIQVHTFCLPLQLNAPQPLFRSAGRLLLRLLNSDQRLFFGQHLPNDRAQNSFVPSCRPRVWQTLEALPSGYQAWSWVDCLVVSWQAASVML